VYGLKWRRTKEAEGNKRIGSWCQGTAQIETEKNQVADVQHLLAVKREMCREEEGHTQVRPYISERGPMNSGPMAKDRRKMLRVNARIVGFVMPYFEARSGRPGAIMELARGVTNVYKETYGSRMRGCREMRGEYRRGMWPSTSSTKTSFGGCWDHVPSHLGPLFFRRERRAVLDLEGGECRAHGCASCDR
jgi:hypothetical protein